MINLKLAQYNSEGKFERFLELTMNHDGFGYYSDRIVLRRFVKMPEYINEYLDTEEVYSLDQKDPLNRFNGLFDGVTYGNGRFVLIASTGLKDKNGKEIFQGDIVKISGHGNYVVEDIRQDFDYLINAIVEKDMEEIVGSIYENPELYEKIK